MKVPAGILTKVMGREALLTSAGEPPMSLVVDGPAVRQLTSVMVESREHKMGPVIVCFMAVRSIKEIAGESKRVSILSYPVRKR